MCVQVQACALSGTQSMIMRRMRQKGHLLCNPSCTFSTSSQSAKAVRTRMACSSCPIQPNSLQVVPQHKMSSCSQAQAQTLLTDSKAMQVTSREWSSCSNISNSYRSRGNSDINSVIHTHAQTQQSRSTQSLQALPPGDRRYFLCWLYYAVAKNPSLHASICWHIQHSQGLQTKLSVTWQV